MQTARFDLSRLTAIYIGGVIGALARVGLAHAFPPEPGAWPWATFAVNMAGTLMLGCFIARLREGPEDELAHPFLATGLCGTLTTFSTFQLELFEMIDDGYLALATAYAGASVLLGYLLVRLGLSLARHPAEIR